MDANNMARELLEKLGGIENIRTNDACMTRLRVGVLDLARVDLKGIRSTEGVMGVVEADTVQIVLGPGVANKVLDAFVTLSGIPRGSTHTDVDSVARAVKNARQSARANRLKTPLKHIANIFVPMLPGIIAAGLINGITNVINASTNGALSGQWWYECMRTMGWALFAYLPIFAGHNAAREFGGSPVLGGIAGAACVANTVMPLLAEYDGKQIVLPMTGAVYNPASGGLIAAMLAGVLFAWLERMLRRVVPDLIESFVVPLVVLIVGGFSIVCILQPVGSALTQGIYAVMSFMYDEMSVLGAFVLSACFLPLVSVGLHQALTPINTMLNDPSGPTGGINYLLPILMMSGGGQVGAGIALYMRAKNPRLRSYVRDSVPVGMLGVGEPLMYAVTLPLGKPFVTACLGAGVGGMVAKLLHIGADSQGVSGLFGLLIVVPGQQLHYLLALLAACASGFVLTWLFGIDETRIDEVYGR